MGEDCRDRQIQWLRWWDLDGNLLLTDREQAAADRYRADPDIELSRAVSLLF